MLGAYMRGVERGVVTATAANQAAARQARQLGMDREFVWRYGFVRKAAWFRGSAGTPWQVLLAQRAFVEELRIADGVKAGLGNFAPGHVGDEGWAVLSQLPALTRLALQHVELARCSFPHCLPRLTHLDLSGSRVHDLSLFTNFPRLRSLTLIANERFLRGQVEALAAMPSLEMLALQTWSQATRQDIFDVLARCEHLHTVALYGPFDPSPISRLPRVRSLFHSGIPSADLDLVRRERPDLVLTVSTSGRGRSTLGRTPNSNLGFDPPRSSFVTERRATVR